MNHESPQNNETLENDKTIIEQKMVTIRDELKPIVAKSNSELTDEEIVRFEELLDEYDELKVKLHPELLNAKLEKAIEIMGEDIITPEDIENTFGFKLENTPEIPFSTEELERARELKQQLILYIDKKEDGTDFVVSDMKGILDNKTSKDNKFLYDSDWYEKDEITNKETPQSGWRLTTPEIIENSTDKNYLEQTETLITYITEEVFKNKELPQEYKDAIEEFNNLNTPEFQQKVKSSTGSEWKEAAKQLSELKINQLTRENYSEIIYRLAIQEKKTGKKNLESKYSWSNSLASSGILVDVGGFDSDGLRVGGWRPGRSSGIFGVCFSRSG